MAQFTINVGGLIRASNRKKIKRGGKKGKNQSLIILSANAQGLKANVESLKNEIKFFNVAIFTIQESHFVKKGQFKLDNFETFEAIRKKHNGGTIIGINKSLNPMLIKDYNDEFELVVVEIKIHSKQIRIISGYGPQETWGEAERLPFFKALEEEIVKAGLLGVSIIIEMDSNSKLGTDFIIGDPHPQSVNGKLLAGIIERNDLVVANGLSAKCVGLITRRRMTSMSTEESIIDHVLISDDLVEYFDSMLIDETGQHALTKVMKTKDGIENKKSDHNTILSTFKFSWKKQKTSNRMEMYNLKNKEHQKTFRELTNKGDALSSVFDNKSDLNEATNAFFIKLEEYIKRCFKKIRISDKPNKELDDLFSKRKELRNKSDDYSKIELAQVETKLAELCAEKNFKVICDEISNIKCDEGGINSGKLWRLKKKLSPRCRDPPTAMLNEEGKLVTNAKEIEKLSLKVFKNRLKNRNIEDNLVEMKKEKEKMCEMRLKSAKNNKTPPWTMKDLNRVLGYLKNNKSRDPFGLCNELFKEDIAGKDLKCAILKLVNRIKQEQKYPEILENCDITSIYKLKGDKNDFNSYRGIFRVPIIRTILDRLIYNDEYAGIDEALSDSNVGARKNRNVRDNIFVLNAVTNSIINGQAQPVDIQVLDIEKCFDALWVEDCINDMFENGFDNDKLPLLYLENQNAQIAVKTPTGTSNRVTINNTIMQGTVWASLCCTTSMEKLGKHVYAHEDLVYKYKENVDIPCLGMIDDILVIQNCSNNSVKINSVVNAFVETKKLRLSKEKCHKIHIQKNNKHEEKCKKLKVHNDTMKESDRVKYLGDILDKSGKVRNTINDRRNKGFGMVAEILAIISEIPLGQHRIEIGLKLRQAMLINGMLFNSEAWHDLLEKEIRLLEEVDEHLLRSLIKGHAKTPLEFLYLECGAMPIRFIISCRRMVYLHTILKRSDEELTKRVYDEQKKAPIRGDFYTLVKKDFEMVGEVIDEDTIL